MEKVEKIVSLMNWRKSDVFRFNTVPSRQLHTTGLSTAEKDFVLHGPKPFALLMTE
jgi:hypothetical protein